MADRDWTSPVPATLVPRRFRHVQRGTEYTLIGLGRAQGSVLDEDSIVLYVGKDGDLWARPEAEFFDGRFVEITPVQGEGECIIPGCQTMTRDGVCRPCDEQVTYVAFRDALTKIANPPTMNGWQELAFWMQRTAADALK